MAVSISGKLFQLNIGSNISFQFRANFASLHNDRAQAGNQLDSRRAERLEETSRRVDKGKRSEKGSLYEVVGPYVGDPAALGQKPDSSTLMLPERVNEKAALLPAEATSRDRSVARSQRWSGKTQQSLSGGQAVHIHSYNRQGQTVFADLRTSAVNFVI